MEGDVHITAAAQSLGVTPHYLRLMERQGRIPPARRGLNGRVYSAFDIDLLRAIGVGSGRRLRRPEDVLAGAQ